MPNDTLIQQLQEEAHYVFDILSTYFMGHSEAPSGALLEAVDYVLNYLGDISQNREFKFDSMEDAFPSVIATAVQKAREEERKLIKIRLYQEVISGESECSELWEKLSDFYNSINTNT